MYKGLIKEEASQILKMQAPTGWLAGKEPHMHRRRQINTCRKVPLLINFLEEYENTSNYQYRAVYVEQLTAAEGWW
jgi:hypothetical protein